MKKKIFGLVSILIILIVILSIGKTTFIRINAVKEQRTSDTLAYETTQGLIFYADDLIEGAIEEGITDTDMEFNTEYLQKLIDDVSNAGGGVVHIPAGTYYFLSAGVQRVGASECVIKCRNNVLIEGEGTDELTGTILMPYAPDNELPVDMFYYNELAESGGEDDTFLVNADFKNFVIDGQNANAETYNSAGKGFMINLFENCDWENVVVKNTDGTGFGVDCPINSTIINCTVIGCGKTATDTDGGASGFGIGTGFCDEESILISNCTAIGNRKYGFFFEHQARFTPDYYTADKSECLVVSNCKSSGNLYNFGGIRANDVTYENCMSYEDEETTQILASLPQYNGTTSRTNAPIKFEEMSVRTHLINCETNQYFTDVVDSSTEYYDAVYWAYNNTITSGISKTVFGIDTKATRAQAVMMLHRMAGRPGEVVKCRYTNLADEIDSGYEDVVVGNTLYIDVEAIIWAREQGIISSESTYFYPTNECERAEAINMLWKYAGEPIVETKHNFTDVASGASYENAINWALNKGIIIDKDGTFRPSDTCTRSELVTFLYRYSTTTNTFSITYNLYEGELATANPTSYVSGTDQFTLNNPTREGYTFEGWTGSNYSEYIEDSSDYVPKVNVQVTKNDTGDKTYSSNWTPNNYIVSFNSNGGSGEMEDEYFTYDFPQVLSPNEFTKEGYIFKGWNTKQDGTGNSYNNTVAVENLTSAVNGEVTLYAQWEAIEHTVEHYKQNIDETYPTTASETENLIGEEGANIEEKTYEGFTLLKMEQEEVSENEIVIKYYYKRKEYNVNITIGRGIESATETKTYKYEETVSLEATLKDGYENIKWTGDYTTNSFKMPANNVEMSVNATEIVYTITYNLGGGMEPGNPTTYTIESETITLKQPTKQGYTFTGWNGSNGETAQKEVTIVQGTIGNKEYTANWIKNTYTITFKNYDGTVLETKILEYGAMPTYSGTPTKATDNTYTYSFKGWDKELVAVTGDATYTATFTANYIEYEIKFVNDDGTEISTKTYHYGDTVEQPANPTKASTVEYTYTFAGWTPSVTTVQEDKTYTATYTQAIRKYEVSFKDEDGTTLSTTQSIEYGSKATKPTDPSKKGHTFQGWYNGETKYTFTEEVKGNVTLTAKWEKETYTITFKNYDGTVLETKTLEYGAIPTYEGTPTKAADNTYTYSFKGWDKELVTVTGDTTYTATFTANYIEYEIKFVNDDGAEISTKTYHYGDTVEQPANPTKASTVEYTYTFAGWTPSITTVQGNKTYTATYTQAIRKYEVSFKDEDGTTLSTTQSIEYGNKATKPTDPTKVGHIFQGWYNGETKYTFTEEVKGNVELTARWEKETYTITFKNYDGTVLETKTLEYGVMPTYEGTLIKASDNTYTYSFKGWDKELVAVTEDATYTATFTANYIEYEIKFVNDDGIEISTKTYHYGDTVEQPANPTKASTVEYTYTFAGWTPSITTVQGNKTYTATYTQVIRKYDVSFKDEDGTTLSTTQSIEYGSKATKPADPTKVGHTFLGWYNRETKYTFTEAVKGNVELTARWEKTIYTITFKDDNGEILKTQEYTIEDEITLYTPIKQYNIFIGWTNEELEEPQTEVIIPKGTTGNKEYIANWELNESNKLQLSVNYSESKPTNESVEVVIISNTKLKAVATARLRASSGWVLSDDQMSLRKEYTENQTETIEITNEYNDTKTVEIEIDNIDKQNAKLETTYQYSEDNKKVTVTIVSSEKLEDLEGWYTEDNITFTKEFELNGTQEIIVKDLAGNETNVTVKIENIKEKEEEESKEEENKTPLGSTENEKNVFEGTIPYAGIKTKILILTIILGITSMILFKKYSKYKDL